MDITEKIDDLFEGSRSSKFKEMKEIKQTLDFFNEELGSALQHEIDNRSAFNDKQRLTFIEHYTVRAIRALPNFKKKLESFQKSLKQKIDFLEKESK